MKYKLPSIVLFVFSLMRGEEPSLPTKPFPWVNSAIGLKFSLKPTKIEFETSEAIPIDFIYTNTGKVTKRLQRGGVVMKHRIEVFRDGKKIPLDPLKMDRAFGQVSFSASPPVLPGKSFSERADLALGIDFSIPGRYTVKASHFFSDDPIPEKPKSGIGYLEAETTFRVIASTN
jgi:hypothetical protein